METLDGIRSQLSALVEYAFMESYEACRDDAVNNMRECGFTGPEEAYQKGLDDAWEAARKIVNAYTHANVENPNGLHKVFGDYLTAHTFDISPSEAIAKIKEFEEKQKKAEEEEVKVGDEVYLVDSNHPRVVTCIFTENGGHTKAVQVTESGKWVVDEIRNLHKTGRTFPQIAEVLEKMKEGD